MCVCVCWDCEGVVYGGNRLLVIKQDEKRMMCRSLNNGISGEVLNLTNFKASGKERNFASNKRTELIIEWGLGQTHRSEEEGNIYVLNFFRRVWSSPLSTLSLVRCWKLNFFAMAFIRNSRKSDVASHASSACLHVPARVFPRLIRASLWPTQTTSEILYTSSFSPTIFPSLSTRTTGAVF